MKGAIMCSKVEPFIGGPKLILPTHSHKSKGQ